MKHKLIEWRVYDNRMTRKSGKCKSPISKVSLVDDLNNWAGFSSILESIIFDDGGVSGIAKKPIVEKIEGNNLEEIVKSTSLWFSRKNTENCHKTYLNQVLSSAAILKSLIYEEMEKLGGRNNCTVRRFSLQPVWNPISTTQLCENAFVVDKLSENEEERYSLFYFLLSAKQNSLTA